MSYTESEAQKKYSTVEQASKDSQPNINFKGGAKGFVHVLDKNTIIFPDLHGNGILHGINDMMENPHIAMLFIDFNTGVRCKLCYWELLKKYR